MDLCQLYGVRAEVVQPAARFKHGLPERHGAVAKLMLLRVISQLTITTEIDLRYAVGMVFQAKKWLARSAGFSPV